MSMNPVGRSLKAGMSIAEEFKAFALKGNVIDLAVGVIIGAAFGKIVESIVKNLLMPLFSLAMPSDQSYLTWKFVVNGKDIPYGIFLGDVLNFVIVAFALFIFVVKFLGWIMRAKAKQDAGIVAPPALSKDQELLSEIRDLLLRQNR